jgi:glutathione S-transferase
VSGVSRIYHIATSADWEQAVAAGFYTRSSVDKTLAEEGFIHASQESQVARTANKFYRDVPGDLLLLVIDTDLVAAEVRYEDVPGAELPFPHIYGPLNTGAVLAAVPLAAGPDGTFGFPPEALLPESGLPESGLPEDGLPEDGARA